MSRPLDDDFFKSQRVQLIYPEKKTVTGMRIMCWADDAFRNGEIDHKPETLEEAIELLEDLGHITTERRTTA